jgi:choloylglycine hydrolase
MTIKRTLWTTVVLLTIAAIQPALACTTFCLPNDGRPIFGRNFDYGIGGGLAVVNKRGLVKVALTVDHPARWVSTYGSVTFNLYGAELPMGGMNEAGLVIENMWLDVTEYPDIDGRPSVGTLQWIQYHLDKCSTVDEVLASAAKLRVSRQSLGKVHYLVTDAGGDCAAIEYLDGEMIVHAGSDLQVLALTNDPYSKSLEFLEDVGSGRAEGMGSLERFARAARTASAFQAGKGYEPIDYAFGILEDVKQGEFTQWTIVYDIAARQIHFRTVDNRAICVVDLAAFDFSCDEPSKMFDLQAEAEGNISAQFEDYSYEKNRALVVRTFKATEFLAGVGEEALRAVARYPGGLICRE